MKHTEGLHEWVVAFSLTLFLHCMVILLAFLPLGNYFFPFIKGGWQGQGSLQLVREAQTEKRPGSNMQPYQEPGEDTTLKKAAQSGWVGGVPFQFGRSLMRSGSPNSSFVQSSENLFQLQPIKGRKPRSLGRNNVVSKLMNPDFSPQTIPIKPLKTLEEEIEENADDYLLSDVYKDAVPLTRNREQLLVAERNFLTKVRLDIEDGRLDMPFAEFIIPAEFYHLSRGLFEKMLQPDFTLEEAMDRFYTRLQRVRAGLPDELNGFGLVMILQRYAENKFYPGDGSGMLLDGLFHNLNDCEGGTKEVISYLDLLYPHLKLGSNRGMLQTTTGEVIGHMQVYIEADATTQKVLPTPHGLVIETTAISEDSIQPFKFGDVYPVEDFILQYYPQIVIGTPLEELLAAYQPNDGDGSVLRNIVGTSDHPLKMSYGTGFKLLSNELYDLENIRTRQLSNAFQQSPIPQCNPNIDPLQVSRENIFSNFVAIDGKLRKSLISHYLADMELWDNQVMPQWKKPLFLATYDDLAATLLAGENDEKQAYIQVDTETAVPRKSLESHGLFLQSQQQGQKKSVSSYLGTGEQSCNKRALIDDQLLSYLFKVPLGPGFYFLPEPGKDFPWKEFNKKILNDCLAVPLNEGERKIFMMLDGQLNDLRGSFRLELYKRAVSRGTATSVRDGEVESQWPGLQKMAIRSIFSGIPSSAKESKQIKNVFAERHSLPSSLEDPSVDETVSELGRTGLSSSILWDTIDFWGPQTLISLFHEFAQRDDLKLTMTRANVLLQNIVSLLVYRGTEPTSIESFLKDITQSGTAHYLRLASSLTLSHYQGRNKEQISAQIVDHLRLQPLHDAHFVEELLGVGLLQQDAKKYYQQRIRNLSSQLPKLHQNHPTRDSNRVFEQAVELLRSVHSFRDSFGYQLLYGTISRSLMEDLEIEKNSEAEVADYGVLVTKIYLLALLAKTEQSILQPKDTNDRDQPLFNKFLAFGENEPLAKPLSSLFMRIYSGPAILDILKATIATQLQDVSRLKSDDDRSSISNRLNATRLDGKSEENSRGFKDVTLLLGRANMVYRMILELSPEQAGELALFLDTGSEWRGDESVKKLGEWYLTKLHGEIAPVIVTSFGEQQIQPTGNNKKNNVSTLPVTFYNDPKVREAMTLLAYSQDKEMGSMAEKKIKFRKSKDLRDLTDLSKIKVIKGSRKITRQDMSQLTLGLNGHNSPHAIAGFWQDTLEVIEKHIEVQQKDPSLGKYLFAPHYPYLTQNNKGFYFPPETIEDLHNASGWGGKNDILLSSYLHFKNLPARLPAWLLETAFSRSDFEQRIIRKFELQTFLPMILECTSDKTDFPDGLFEAKWSIRKPFGEDIFPGTLLLLRTGYMEINESGELQFTEKGLQARG